MHIHLCLVKHTVILQNFVDSFYRILCNLIVSFDFCFIRHVFFLYIYIYSYKHLEFMPTLQMEKKDKLVTTEKKRKK